MIKHLPSYRPALRRALWNAVEALPLPTFLVCMQATQPVVSADWRLTYYLSAAVALTTTVIVLRQGVVLNRLHLALNLYYLSGSVGLLLNWEWLNRWYGKMEAAAMFFSVVVVGALSTLGSPYGFIGVPADRRCVRNYSMALLVLSLALATVSWCFVGNNLLSAYGPFIVLFGAHALLRGRARTAGQASN